MIRLSDELLMAYADGALPKAEAAEVAEALDHDAEARALVEDFRRTAGLARAAFADVAAEPVPDALVRTVLGAGARTANVTDIARARRPRLSSWRTALPMAASLALVLGLAAMLVLRPAPVTTPAPIIALGPVAPATPVAEMLEKRPSGVALALTHPESAHVMVVATFRDRNARICREVEVLDSKQQPQLAGVACRDPALGTWTMEGTARIAAAAPAAGRDFVPSGADEKDALDGLLSILGATTALPADEEARLMRGGWR